MENKTLMLYVHIPFCVRKCLYCDFLSFPAHEDIHREYVKNILKEIHFRSLQENFPSVSSIFFGGGTPSILDPGLLAEIMDEIRKDFTILPDCEITLEANPASAISYKMKIWRQEGVNRLSIGLQSASDQELKTLGRIHIYSDFLKCFQSARMADFRNINIDLMNCIPGQTAVSWKNTLKNVLLLRPEHISVYNLIIEENTPFKKLFDEGKLLIPNEEECEKIDSLTKSLLMSHGFSRYEISNYSKPGFRSLHNYGYWSDTPYLGFGLGASSYYKDKRLMNTCDMRSYLSLDMEQISGNSFSGLFSDIHPLSRKEEMEEFMFLGLRRIEGVSSIRFKEKFQVSLENVFGDSISKYLSSGLMGHSGSRYFLSERGLDVSNRILSDFLL